MQIPSQVWVGPEAELKKQVISFLQQQFCKNASAQPGCKCLICEQICTEQFYQILWLSPQNQYKVEQVREVLARLALRLGQGENFYFIFQAAHCLNEACANSLLKSIEEPPAGYNFIFLTPRKELLLATVLSRSLIKYFNTTESLVAHQLVIAFTTKKLNPIEFGALLEQYKDLTDQDSRTLFDQIYGYWLHQAKQTTELVKLAQIQKKITRLQQAQDYLPMPGSGKLFWRNLYMQV